MTRPSGRPLLLDLQLERARRAWETATGAIEREETPQNQAPARFNAQNVPGAAGKKPITE